MGWKKCRRGAQSATPWVPAYQGCAGGGVLAQAPRADRKTRMAAIRKREVVIGSGVAEKVGIPVIRSCVPSGSK